MSTTIDNRVLEMRFDNKQFEQGVSTTMSTLDKLKQKLNLTGASKGLEDISRASKNVDMSGLGRGVETVQAKFSALQVAGVTALVNITNHAVNTGKRMVKALTIDPIKTGFQEYETQMGAVQTILANTQSKGSTLQDVNRALAELNTYADKTIYNFTEMTKNIGTFTAAGVDLDKSVTSIKGIANLAAVSGSTSQQASTAMYQLSQALAAGKVSLMDWNSVVNAGMGGELFQNALKRTAKQMGHNVDAMIEKYGSFRESLTQGEWLTTEVLTETLTQLSGAYSKADLIAQGYTESQAAEIVKLAETAVSAATEVKTFTQLWDTLKESVQSGWTQSWQTIIGDFGEAKELLTGISKGLGEMIEASANARNKVLTEGLSSGWKQMLAQGIDDEEGFKDSIKSVAKERGIAIDKMIEDSGSFEKSLKQGWLTGDILTESLDKMTKKVSGLSAEQLKERGYTEEQVKALQKLNESVKNGTIDMDEFAKKMTMTSGRENMIAGFKNIFDGLLSVAKPIKEAFRDIFPAITGEQLYNFTEKFKEFTSHLKLSGEAAKKVKSTFKGVFSVIDIGVEAFKAIGKGIFDLIGNFTGLGGGILGATGSFGDFLTNIRDSIVEGNLFGKVVDKIVGFLTNAISSIKDFGKSIKENVDMSSIFQGFFGFFKGLWNIVKSVGSAIGDVFGDIGNVLADAFGNGDIFEVINSGLFASILLAIRNFIKGLSDSFEKINFLDRVKEILDGVKGSLESWQQNIQAGTLLKIAGALGILAAALYVISGIDSEKLGQSLGAIGVLFGELIGAMALMGKLNDASINPLQGIVGILANISRTISMIGLGAAVLILAGAMRMIADLDWEGVKKGLVGVSVMVGVLVAAARLMNTESKSITKFAGQMIILSAAVAALSGVAKILGSMSWEELAKGGIGVVTLVTVLIQAARKMDSADASITKFAGQMLIMSAAIGILAIAGKVIATMSWGELAKAGAGILVLVTMLVQAAKKMDSADASITKFGGQMLLMAASLAVLSPVLKSLGSMSIETLAKGLITIGIALAELSYGLKAMDGSLSGSAALLVAAGALALIAPALNTLGSMSVGGIAKSLITLAAAFAVIGVAGYLLSPLIPTILGLAGAFALFGVATLGIGVGMAAIAAGFTALATAGAAGAAAFVAALTVIVTGVLNLIPEIAQIIGRGIVEIAKIIGDYAPQLGESFLKLILGVLQSLEMYAPQIVDSLLNFFIGVFNSLTNHVPELIQVAMNFIGAIFQGIVDALGSIDAGNLLKGVIAVGIMTALMYALSGVVALIPSAMAGMLGVGAVIAEMTLVLAAIGALSQIPGLEWLIGEGGDLLQKIGTAIGQFVGGIVGGVAEGVSSSLPQVATNLSSFMENIQPFISGAQAIDPSMMEGVQSLAKAIIMLTAADILDSITSFITGGNSIGDFANQLVPLGEGMKKFGEAVAGVDTASISASASAAKALIEVANAIPSDGGLWGLLAGDKDLGSFGSKLVPFGMGMKMYATAVSGIDTAAITASASAAKALVEVANAIPSDGGLWQLIAGDKDLGSFGQKLVPFGLGMKLYSSAVAGLNSESIAASASAAQAIVSVANTIPAEGGFWQLLSGEKDLASFGLKLVPFGMGMKAYAATVSGIDMTSITASASAAKALVEVASAIPPDGGFWQLLSGEKDLASFGTKLVPFGLGMKLYASSVSGIDIASITASTTAAKALVSVANAIPVEGGFWSLIDGEKDLAGFGMKLIPFGQSMKKYAESVAGVDSSSIILSAVAAQALISVANAVPAEGGFWSLIEADKDLGSFGQKLIPFGKGMKSYAEAVAGIDTASIAASVPAAMALISVANAVPAEGGFWSLVDGDKDLGSFGTKLVPFGMGMKMYATAVAGIDSASIIASTAAAHAIVSVANAIPAEGGFWSLVDGKKDLASFGTKLVPFGKGMKSYSEAVAGLDPAPIVASTTAAKALVKVAEIIPKEGGITSWFSGEQDLGSFGKKLAPFGKGMKSYANAVAGLNVTAITASVPAAKAMVKVTNAIPSNFGSTITNTSFSGLGAKLSSFGNAMKTYSTSVAGVSASSITSSVSAAKSLVSLVNSTAGIKTGGVSSFVNAINTLGKAQVKNFVQAFSSASPQMASAGSKLIQSFINSIKAKQSALTSTAKTIISQMENAFKSKSSSFQTAGSMLMTKLASGIKSKSSTVKSAASSVVSSAASACGNKYSAFYNAGANISKGLAAGIRSGVSAARTAARELAAAADEAARARLKINSPSKVFRAIGAGIPEGMAQGVTRFGGMVKRAVTSMSTSAIGTTAKSIARISDLVNSNIDAQPTIRPVVDLSDVKSGARSINGMLNIGSRIGVSANIDRVSSLMSKQNQNGGNDDVVSAINKLGKRLGNTNSTTYNVNGVNVNNNSDVSSAIETLIRYAVIEGRA